jgi:hypothetical protein
MLLVWGVCGFDSHVYEVLREWQQFVARHDVPRLRWISAWVINLVDGWYQ